MRYAYELAFCIAAVAYLGALGNIEMPFTPVFKVLPIVLLIIASRYYSARNPDSKRLRYLLGALIFCALGDISLCFQGENAFLAGLGLFLCGHIFYIKVFYSPFHFSRLRLVGIIVITLYAALFASFILPNTGGLLTPVILYMCVISMMAATAILSFENVWLSQLGAVTFLLSDSLLAFEIFMPQKYSLTLGVMLSYYLAQLFIFKGVIRRYLT